MDSATQDSVEVVAYDAADRKLTIGCIVETMRTDYVRRNVSSSTDESSISKIASKRAVVHDIFHDSKIYIEVLDESIVGTIPSNCVVLDRQPVTKVKLNDGSLAQIGSFVKIPEEERSDWIHGMAETFGKTGKIVRITQVNGDILVQFAWGPRFYYKPNDLCQSSAEDIMTQNPTDPNQWIHVGNIVQVTKSQTEFLENQKQNNLNSYDSAKLTGQYMIVKKILIKAFSSSRVIQLSKADEHSKEVFSVNIDNVQMIDHFVDNEGNSIRVPGDKVRLNKDEVQLKTELGIKMWDPQMKSCLGLVGQTKYLRLISNCLWVKVDFDKIKSFYFKPSVLALQKDTDSGFAQNFQQSLMLTPNMDKDDKGIPSTVEVEMIQKEDLTCGDFIGQGSYGSVYSGKWCKNGQLYPVAIKMILLNAAVDRNVVRNEAETQHFLGHPNIVRLFGINENPKELWIIMELVNGQDLSSLLFKKQDPYNQLDFETKRKLCLDMCNAIAFIHQRKFTHCDIKPHNMIVDSKSGKLFICDFGITRFLGEENMNTMFVKYTKHLIGTKAYLAPECYQMDKETKKVPVPTYASDVWSLGVVFYEIFTETRFCEELQYKEYLEFINRNDDQLVKKKISIVQQNIRPIVEKALNFQPRLRPTAQQLSEFFHELSK